MADHGGLTQTHMLLASSPAIDAGDPGFMSPPDFDQRGAPFVRVVDGGVAGVRIDMGATERQTVPGLNLVVDTPIDENDGDYSAGDLSLREAVGLANGSVGTDVITFDALVFNSPETIALRLGELRMTESVSIAGPGQGLLTIDAAQQSRIFNVDDDAGSLMDVTISRLTLTGGNSAGSGGAILSRENVTVTGSSITDNSAGIRGGGINSFSGNLTLSAVVISDNSAAAGGGVAVTGGNMTSISGSTISGNTAFSGDGGGVYFFGAGNTTITLSTISGNTAAGAARGGGIYSFTTNLTITQSTISGNTAAGAARGGGVYARNGPLNIVESTISGNEARGGPADGGGVYITGDVLSITLSTISGNAAHRHGGGILVAPNPQTTATITHTTIAGNQADADSSGLGSGGGLFAPGGGGPRTLAHTIVADNMASAPVNGGDVFGTINADFSLIEETAGVFITGAGNILGSDPSLGVLANNGGPTQTHALMVGSPAIDMGNMGFSPPPNHDQRGFLFVRVFEW